MKTTRGADRIFLVSLIFLHAVSYLLALKFQRFYNGDSFEYIQEAFNIKEHFFFYSGNTALPIVDEYKTLRTPGYPLFLLLIYSVAISSKVVLLLQNVISICNIALARNILTTLGYSKKYDWLFLLFVVAFPSQFIYANTVAPDIVLQTFVLFYFRYTVVFCHRRSWQPALAMSGMLAAGLFIKPVLYPLAVLNCVAVIILMLRWKLRPMPVTAVAIFPLLVVGAYCYWNNVRTGKFHFTSIQSFNSIYYHNNYVCVTKGTAAARYFLENTNREVARERTFAARYDAAQRIGVDLLRQQPVSYTLFHLKKSLLFFFETGRGEMDLFTGKMTLGRLYADDTRSFRQTARNNTVNTIVYSVFRDTTLLIAVIVLIFDAIKMIGLILFLYRTDILPAIKWFIILLLAYFALITGPISNAHYVLPVSLLISGLAVIGFSTLLRQRRNNSIITT